MGPEEAVAIIRELLLAEDQSELQERIALHLPRMDHDFFGLLVQLSELESARNPVVGAKLASLAQVLLPLRTLI